MRFPILLAALLTFSSVTENAEAAGLFKRLFHRNTSTSEESDLSDSSGGTLPAGIKLLRDVPYGSHEKQKMDVYIPEGAHDAPVIFMVHGGGWKRGDKGGSHMGSKKASHWCPKGFIYISTNYRMVPDGIDPLRQADDIADAIAFAQAHAASWGGDPSRFILMGHSAGAHLVAMVTSDPNHTSTRGVQSWLGSIFLDSGALNVTEIMEVRHFGMYDNAFGADPAYWQKTSPTSILTGRTVPALAVCSAKRKNSCNQAHVYADRSAGFGNKVQVLEEQLNHGEILGKLTEGGDYTAAIEQFMGSLEPGVKAALAH